VWARTSILEAMMKLALHLTAARDSGAHDSGAHDSGAGCSQPTVGCLGCHVIPISFTGSQLFPVAGQRKDAGQAGPVRAISARPAPMRCH
jgi:hypothetical protein